MISFIIINYNTKDLTYQTIKSILNSFDNENSFEMILIDNASIDGSKEFFTNLEKKIDNFKYIYNEENYGFGKANNIGFKHSTGEYIYILNSDTMLHTKNIDKIIKDKFSQYSDAGVIATKVQYEDGTPQPNVQNFTTLTGVFLRLLKIGQLVRNSKLLFKFINIFPFKPHFVKVYLDNFNKEREEGFVDWASGCSLIFKRELYEKLGGFDENFFMYSEDEEICLRVHKLGYSILYTPNILITHLEGKSNTNKNINEFLTEEKVKSEFYLFKKHYSKKIKNLKIIYVLISSIGSFFSKRLKIIKKSMKGLSL